MTQAHKLARRYRALASALEAVDGAYTVHSLKVWNLRLNIPTVHVEVDGWSWGYCENETCNHVSHDPKMSGATVHVLARCLGEDPEDSDRVLYVLQNGTTVAHIVRYQGHYAPIAKLELA